MTKKDLMEQLNATTEALKDSDAKLRDVIAENRILKSKYEESQNKIVQSDNLKDANKAISEAAKLSQEANASLIAELKEKEDEIESLRKDLEEYKIKTLIRVDIIKEVLGSLELEAVAI